MSIQNEFSSFKLLLKQVYSAHTAKVKELENEVKVLKEKLNEKEREINSSLSDCKRCVELEEAFKSCKKALHDQSKMFESFGKKFSIFNSPDFGSQEVKSEAKFPETNKFSRSLKSTASFYDKNEPSIISLEDTVTESKVNATDGETVMSNSQNLLKKVLCSDLGSFDACTVTFPETFKHGNIKSDSLIFAPDSLDASLCCKKECENVSPKKHSKWQVKKRDVNENSKENEKNCPETKVSCKRLSDSSTTEISADRVKRCNARNETSNKPKDIKIDFQSPNVEISNEVPNVSSHAELKSKMSLKDSNAQNSKLIKKKIAATEASELKVSICEMPKNQVNNLVSDLKNKFTPHEISPSLLPTVTNAQPKILEVESTSSDNDDFQELGSVGKSAQNEDSWDTCDKKKYLRKNPKLNSIKFSSKFKMTLEAPPLNFKKPVLKQTKLSKSIFKPKEEHEKSPVQDVQEDVIEDDSPLILDGKFQTSTQRGLTKSPCAVDIDATFIPENFRMESSHFATSSVKKNAVEKSNFKNGGLFSNISFPDEFKPSVKDQDSSKKEMEVVDHSSLDDGESKENMNSFDRLPLPDEPNYKYKNDVVRKKTERKQLNAFGCKECEKYYSELGLTDKERKERMKKCSRHRGKFTPPSTPDHFWELDFPDTEECKARGYMNATQKVKLNNIVNI